MAPFVILGGGPCGLAAAWELARSGHAPIVLEREALVGGLCATYAFGDHGEYRFDLGGHRFLSSDEKLSRWVEDLLGDDLLTAERKSVVLHNGRRFRYPLDGADLLKNLGLRENLRALLGYAKVRARAPFEERRDVTFEDWVVARFGRPLYDVFFGPYTEKLWGIPPNTISADWAAERISLLNLGDAALRLLNLRDTPIRTYARRYRYPRLGMGQIFETLAHEIRARGGEIRTNARVVGVETAGDRAIAVTIETPHGIERIPCGELFATIPLTELARSLRPDLPIERTRALRFRAITFLNMSLARRDFSENTWMYVAQGGLRLSRIQEPKRRSVAMAPPGRTSIMLEIPCDVGDDIWRASLPDLKARMLRELGELRLAPDDVTGAYVVRVEHGYPIYHVGYDADRRALMDEVHRFANVRTAGRQGLFRYISVDSAMQMGIRAAEQMIQRQRGGEGLDMIGRGTSVTELRALTA